MFKGGLTGLNRFHEDNTETELELVRIVSKILP